MLGLDGDDTLNGSNGADVMLGGNGNDRIVYTSTSNAVGDSILDFTAGQDKIDFSAIDANTGTPVDNAFTFIDHSNLGNTGTGITGLGQLSYYLDGATGHYMLAGNTAGSTAAEFTIDLGTQHKTLSAADFVL
jgi:Ca2+-binding RTX toxin-like protein